MTHHRPRDRGNSTGPDSTHVPHKLSRSAARMGACPLKHQPASRPSIPLP
jgi:hypothetical protein